jgi:hypothetical protein
MDFDLDVFALAIGTMAFVWTFCAILLLADWLDEDEKRFKRARVVLNEIDQRFGR